MEQEWLDRREKVSKEASPSLPLDIIAQNNLARIPDTGLDRIFNSNPFIAGLVSIEISPSKRQRQYLLIQNNSANDMFIGFGKAATAGTAIKIPSGGNYETYFFVPTNHITVLATGANSSGVILEGYNSQFSKGR